MEKDKAVSWLIRIFSIAILLGTIVWTITQTGVISLIGTEDVYWERARFLLGQGGATIYDGSSICSLGYSLILLPICALIKSPYAAYKAAVLLNGIFLVGAYLFATVAAGKLFPRERESFLCAACFFAVFTPALMIDKTFTGPEMSVLLLMWISIYLLASIWEEMRTWKVAGLAACMIFIGFLQITALGVILAVIILLGFYVRRQRLSGTAFVGFMLAVLLGIAAGNVGERIFLSAFTKDLDLGTVASSMEVLFSGITAFEETGWFTGLFTTIAGKLFSVLIGTFLLACPAIWQLGRALFSKKKDKEEVSLPVLGITGIFVFQFLFMCLYDNSLGISKGMLSLSGLEIVLPILMLAGIVRIKNLKEWDRQLPAYLLLLCVCTFAAGAAMQAQKIDGITSSTITNAGNGFLMIFQGLNKASTPMVIYMAACVVLLIALVLAFLFLGNKKRLIVLQRILGTAVAVIAFCVINVCASSVTVQALSEEEMEDIAPFASLINGIQENCSCVYLSASSNDRTVPILQSLIPDIDLAVIEKDTKEQQEFFREMQLEQEPENLLIFTDSSQENVQSTYQPMLTDYRVLYMTQTCTLWAPKESTLAAGLESGVEQRTETLAFSASDVVEADEDEEENENAAEPAAEEEISDDDGIPSDLGEEEEPVENPLLIYGGNVPLAGGTYTFRVILSEENPSEGDAEITISDENGTLYETTIDEQIFNEEGQGVLTGIFTTRDPVWNVKFSAEGALLNEADIEQVSYQKDSSAYMVGLDDWSEINAAALAIVYWDGECGKQGSVAYVDSLAENPNDISTQAFENYLPDYEVQAVTENELDDLEADYLIAETSSHAFYPVMDTYSVIIWGEEYSLLMRNESAQMMTFTEENGQVLSDGTQIDVLAFTGSDNPNAKISLDKGDYLYHSSLTYDTGGVRGNDADLAGTLFIKNGSSVLAEEDVTFADLRNGAGELDFEIPLTLSSQKNSIKCSFETDLETEFELTPVSVELISQKYPYGKEEPALLDILDMVNTLENGADLFVVLSENDLEDQSVETSWLMEQVPLCNVEEISADAALKRAGDGLLLTYSLHEYTLTLLDQYSILGHAGKYTLWAKNNDSYLTQLLEAGAAILNSGTKLSPHSIAMMSGKTGEDGTIASLPRGRYTFYVNVTARDLDPDDTVELTLYRDKKEKEIEEELEELDQEDYTEEEAQDMIDPQTSCGSVTCEAWKFDDSDNMIVKVTKDSSGSAKNLCCDAYTWKNGDVEAEIVWVEVSN